MNERVTQVQGKLFSGIERISQVQGKSSSGIECVIYKDKVSYLV